ncbi:MAG: outer membrane lipid asymmetry maintenance protein MlaD [Holosporales bacterium]|jgi:phospholipid/cholesterol/gamma-HCH transport system substrate-binding protein|nr:outer membrane lipid asymmetry maintenance protein MlaD [Holosporales bacterium]
MGNNRTFESFVGFAVVLITIFFSLYAFNYSKLKHEDGYVLFANFDRIDGINVGSELRIGGIKVGNVIKIELDQKSYLVKVSLLVKKDITLPKDTIAKVETDGLLGGKYLSLDPGAEDSMLKPGDEISRTQGSITLESLIGKFLLFSSGSEKKASN